MEWEYRKVTLRGTNSELPFTKLTMMGMEGWELVGIQTTSTDVIYFFKRPINR